MKVYKDRQYLVFALDDGSTVKYDFATKSAIGKKGGEVRDLCGQLHGVSFADMIDNCIDKQYAKFLMWVKTRCPSRGSNIVNIGTILKHVPEWSKYEQYFSAGIDSMDADLNYRISDVPAGLIKLCREHGLKLSNNLILVYKQIPDAVNDAFGMKYMSLVDIDIYELLTRLIYSSATGWKKVPWILFMQERYGYTLRPFLNYIDYLKTFEAFDRMYSAANELQDYCRMMAAINPHFEKYPKHLLTTHQIAIRNYNRLNAKFDEEAFAKVRRPDMEWTYGRYIFVYPKTTQDIKDEAVMQNNCVAGYIQDVIDGMHHVMFMRDRSDPEHSLVTLQIVDGKIIQAKQHYNYNITDPQRMAVEAWNRWYAEKQRKVA